MSVEVKLSLDESLKNIIITYMSGKPASVIYNDMFPLLLDIYARIPKNVIFNKSSFPQTAARSHSTHSTDPLQTSCDVTVSFWALSLKNILWYPAMSAVQANIMP